MSDKYPRFIIAEHNSEPAPPEYMYYCGVKCSDPRGSKGTPEINLEKSTKDQVLWDDDKDSARQLRSLASVVSACNVLEKLGFENLRVFKITLNYESVDQQAFKNLMKKQRVHEILSNIDEDDVEYLKEAGVFDLTKVT